MRVAKEFQAKRKLRRQKSEERKNSSYISWFASISRSFTYGTGYKLEMLLPEALKRELYKNTDWQMTKD